MRQRLNKALSNKGKELTMKKLATITCKFEVVTIEMEVDEEDEAEVSHAVLVAEAISAAMRADDITVEIADMDGNVTSLH